MDPGEIAMNIAAPKGRAADKLSGKRTESGQNPGERMRRRRPIFQVKGQGTRSLVRVLFMFFAKNAHENERIAVIDALQVVSINIEHDKETEEKNVRRKLKENLAL